MVAIIEETDGGETVETSKLIQNKNLLAQFWKLASLDETTRVASVMDIIQELKEGGRKVYKCILLGLYRAFFDTMFLLKMEIKFAKH